VESTNVEQEESIPVIPTIAPEVIHTTENASDNPSVIHQEVSNTEHSPEQSKEEEWENDSSVPLFQATEPALNKEEHETKLPEFPPSTNSEREATTSKPTNTDFNEIFGDTGDSIFSTESMFKETKKSPIKDPTAEIFGSSDTGFDELFQKKGETKKPLFDEGFF